MFRVIFLYTLAIFFFIGSIGFFSHLFINPFFRDSTTIVSADPYYLMSLLLGLSAGFFAMAPLNVLSRQIRGRELATRTLLIASICFGLSALVLNSLLYRMIIEPQGLVECDSKAGYNKNLLTDYAKNLNGCRKD